jgi:hypothetical protein
MGLLEAERIRKKILGFVVKEWNSSSASLRAA